MPQTILALLEEVEAAPAVLATASLLQQRLQSGPIQVLHISHDPREGFMPTEEVRSRTQWEALRDQAASRSTALKAIVDSWQQSPDQAQWHERTGDTSTILRTDCAMADFIVAGRPASGPARETVRALLFDVRRATLVAPRAAPRSLGRHVVIAWKESASARAALRLAMPVLQRAEHVTLLIGDEDSHVKAEEPAAIIQTMGAAHISVEFHHVSIEGHEIGTALIQEAVARGGDLLVMGAYTHNRLREMLLGGATREILRDATLPVVLAH